jgi:hypothetical protein
LYVNTAGERAASSPGPASADKNNVCKLVDKNQRETYYESVNLKRFQYADYGGTII